MDTIIECSNVVRIFGSRNPLTKKQQVRALDGLDLVIPKGIVFGLLGPNGSGKTTTIRILSTLLTPTSGQARVMGFDCVKEAKKIRGKIGLILGGERGLYGRLTGEENLKYFAALNHLSREITRKRIQEIIELVGLTSAGNRPVEQYSRGMRQRLHVARGLLTDPEVLFMDEPTIGIDPQGAQELRQLIPQFTQRGKTVLLTTHYMSEADELSSQVGIINHGKIIASGTPTEIKRSFSNVAVCEVICRQSDVKTVESLRNIPDIQRVAAVPDGPLQRLTIHVLPGIEIKPSVTQVLGKDNIESIVMRDPTLEEAYLSIIK
jgi:ABC-2 type transport system ATP-binding protein